MVVFVVLVDIVLVELVPAVPLLLVVTEGVVDREADWLDVVLLEVRLDVLVRV